MNTDDKLDHVSDTIAFLLARIKNDEKLAMAVVGGDAHNIVKLLIGMTDLAMGMVMMIAPMVGSTPEAFVEVMAMGAKFYGPEFMDGRK